MENTNRTRMEKRTREIFGRLKIIKDAKKNVAVIWFSNWYVLFHFCTKFRFRERKKMKRRCLVQKNIRIYFFPNVLFESIHKGLRSCKKIPNNVFSFPCIRFDFERKMYFYLFFYPILYLYLIILSVDKLLLLLFLLYVSPSYKRK